MDHGLLLPGERLDDLQRKGMRIIQHPKRFRFGTDAVLLSDFAHLRRGDRVADIGAGTGAVALLMAARQEHAQFDMVEIHPEQADMARRSVAINGLERRIRVHCHDLRHAHTILGYGGYDLITANPPYGVSGDALPSLDEGLLIARHDKMCTLNDIAECAHKLLRNGGRLAVVYPAAMMYRLMCALDQMHIAPKRVRLVHGRAELAPKLVLLEAVKGAGSMLHWLPSLVLREKDGSPTPEYRRIYGMDEP